MRGRSEPGAVTIVFALFAVALMATVAIVIDIGRIRNARRTDQSAADLAALAGGQVLAEDGATPQDACEAAIDFLVANVDDVPSTASVPCSSLPDGCAPGTASVTVTDGGTAAPFQIAITYPIADDAIADPLVGGLRVTDGEPCERIGVRVDQELEALFAQIVDIETLRTDASAVARSTPSWLRQSPNLWLLDPTGCTALSVQGGSQVIVGTATKPGLITLDSDGTTCSSNAHTIDVGGSGSRIRAIPATTDPPGRISLVAMVSGQLRCDDGNPAACEQGDVDLGMLDPQPTRRYSAATRALVDHRFNCRTGYPDYHGVPIADCPDAGTRDAHIDQVRREAGPAGTPLPGFQRWRASYGCNNPAVPPVLPGNWWIDCNNLKVTGETLDFTGGNVVFDGDLTVNSGSVGFNTANPAGSLPPQCQDTVAFCLAESSAEAGLVYFRDGDLTMTGGSLQVSRAAVILNQGDTQLSSAPPVWSAPREGPFTALALWAEAASTKFRINGGASLDLEGVFFTPEADAFTITGGSPLVPQRAQFISYRLEVSGGTLRLDPEGLALVELKPNPPS